MTQIDLTVFTCLTQSAVGLRLTQGQIRLGVLDVRRPVSQSQINQLSLALVQVFLLSRSWQMEKHLK